MQTVCSRVTRQFPLQSRSFQYQPVVPHYVGAVVGGAAEDSDGIHVACLVVKLEVWGLCMLEDLVL